MVPSLAMRGIGCGAIVLLAACGHAATNVGTPPASSRAATPGVAEVEAAMRTDDSYERSAQYRAAGDAGGDDREAVIRRLRAAEVWEAAGGAMSGHDALTRALGREDHVPPIAWARAAMVKLGDAAERAALIRGSVNQDQLVVLAYIADPRLLRLALPLLDSDGERVIDLGGHVPSVRCRAKDEVVNVAASMRLVRVSGSFEICPRYPDALIAEARSAISAQPPP